MVILLGHVPEPECSPGCPMSWVGDGMYDAACDVLDCVYDNDDLSHTETSLSERIMSHLWMWAFKLEKKMNGKIALI